MPVAQLKNVRNFISVRPAPPFTPPLYGQFDKRIYSEN